MRLSIIVPDGLVIVDGDARRVDLSGIDPAIHAVQWEETIGDVEYGKPRPRNESFTDITPYQGFLDRWILAAPPAPPPPPTKEEMIEHVLRDPALRAILLELASKVGLDEGSLRVSAHGRMP